MEKRTCYCHIGKQESFLTTFLILFVYLQVSVATTYKQRILSSRKWRPSQKTKLDTIRAQHTVQGVLYFLIHKGSVSVLWNKEIEQHNHPSLLETKAAWPEAIWEISPLWTGSSGTQLSLGGAPWVSQTMEEDQVLMGDGTEEVVVSAMEISFYLYLLQLF